MAYTRHVTLTANTVQSWTFPDNSSVFEIINRNGAGEVYVSHDGTVAPTDPTVGGNNFDVIPAAVGAGFQMTRLSQLPITVKVISAAATAVSIRSLS